MYAFRIGHDHRCSMASADICIVYGTMAGSHACNKHAAHRQKEVAKTDLAVEVV